MNMFKPVQATTVNEYLAAVPADRKKDMLFLHDFIKKTVPALKPHFAYNMLGYGSFPYKNYKGETVPWPTVSLANQKHYISLYVCSVENGRYVAETYKNKLGKVNVGRSCIRFKRATDLDLGTLAIVLRKAQELPGLTGAKTKS